MRDGWRKRDWDPTTAPDISHGRTAALERGRERGDCAVRDKKRRTYKHDGEGGGV